MFQMHAHQNCFGVYVAHRNAQTHKQETHKNKDYRGLSMCVDMHLVNETICILSSTYCKVIARVLLSSIDVDEIVFVANVYVIFID